MDQEQSFSIDINSADEVILTQLQGVGTRLAQRIIDARPFESMDDLTRVQGLSENDVERLKPFLTISGVPEETQALDETETKDTDELTSVEEMEQVEMISEDSDLEHQSQESDEIEITEDFEEDGLSTSGDEHIQEGLDTDEPGLAEEDIHEIEDITGISEIEDQEPIPDELKTVEGPPVTQPTYITRGGACGLVLISGFFIVLLAVAITLGVISSINRGQLNYASPGDIASLQSQTDMLSSKNQVMSEDIEGIRNRMDNLESLSGQVSEMEAEISALKEELTSLQAHTEANQAAIEELVLELENIQEELQTLNARGERFESFLDGLRTLMEELFPQPTENPETEEIP
jgi:ribosomal protein S13